MKINKEIYRFILIVFLIIICIILYHIFTKKSLPPSRSHAATYKIGSSAQSIAGIDSSGNLSNLSFPTGMIMIWYPQDDAVTSLNGLQKDIPAGWAICDGSNGTPDLRGRFVLMAQDVIPSGAPAPDPRFTQLCQKAASKPMFLLWLKCLLIIIPAEDNPAGA